MRSDERRRCSFRNHLPQGSPAAVSAWFLAAFRKSDDAPTHAVRNSCRAGCGQRLERAANATGEPIGRAASYINPDIGAVTEKPNVHPDSDCLTPDRNDAQQISPAGTTTNNVHNDAWFLQNGEQVSGPASFQSVGVGVISACPDPDGAGPEFSVLSDSNGDGQADLCYQPAYQTGKGAGDTEYRAQANSVVAGRQFVLFCSDVDANGCRDERNRSSITISWRR